MRLDLAQQFLNRLTRIGQDLPFSPRLLQQLYASTDEDSPATLDEIAQVLGKDQGLTARILALANSAFYGMQSHVPTVRRAVALLGLRQVRSLVLAVSLRGLADRRRLPPGFSLREHWKHQMLVAVTARDISPLAGVDVDLLFTAGILHDLGKMLIALYMPDVWIELERLCAPRTAPCNKIEDEYWGLDHGGVGGLVLRAWSLPPILEEAVSWHHQAHRSHAFPRECNVLCLADALIGHSQTACPWMLEAATLSASVLGLDLDQARPFALDALEDPSIEQFAQALA